MHDDGTTSNDDRLGAVGDLRLVIEKRGLEDDELLVLAGDNLFELSLPRFVEWSRAKPQPASAVPLHDVGDLELATHYGIAETDDAGPHCAVRREAERSAVDARFDADLPSAARARTPRSRLSSTRARAPTTPAASSAGSRRGSRLRLPVRRQLVRHREPRAAARGGQQAAAERAGCPSARRTASTESTRSRHISRPSVGACSTCSCRSAASCAAAAGGSSARAVARSCRGSSRRSARAAARRRRGRSSAAASARGAGSRSRAPAPRSATTPQRAGSSTRGRNAGCGGSPPRPRSSSPSGCRAPEVDALTFVPADRGRRLERGHNPAERLARRARSALGAPVRAAARADARRTAARQLGGRASHGARRLPRDEGRAAHGRRGRRRVHDRCHRCGRRERPPRRWCTPGRGGRVRTRDPSVVSPDAVRRDPSRVRSTAQAGDRGGSDAASRQGQEPRGERLHPELRRAEAPEARPPRPRTDAGRDRARRRAEPVDRRLAGGRGDRPPQGPHAARPRGRARHEGRDRRARGQARPPGQRTCHDKRVDRRKHCRDARARRVPSRQRSPRASGAVPAQAGDAERAAPARGRARRRLSGHSAIRRRCPSPRMPGPFPVGNANLARSRLPEAETGAEKRWSRVRAAGLARRSNRVHDAAERRRHRRRGEG